VAKSAFVLPRKVVHASEFFAACAGLPANATANKMAPANAIETIFFIRLLLLNIV
jgi:hypothetical protein